MKIVIIPERGGSKRMPHVKKWELVEGVLYVASPCNGVLEYLAWLALKQEFRWYLWKEGGHQSQKLDKAGSFRGQVFSRLWLDTAFLSLMRYNLIA